MSRYIDADKACLQCIAHHMCNAENCIVAQQPTADVVEVVRCKDCIYFVPDSGERDPLFGLPLVGAHCGLFENTGYRDRDLGSDITLRWCGENDFCSDGVRKEDAE